MVTLSTVSPHEHIYSEVKLFKLWKKISLSPKYKAFSGTSTFSHVMVFGYFCHLDC